MKKNRIIWILSLLSLVLSSCENGLRYGEPSVIDMIKLYGKTDVIVRKQTKCYYINKVINDNEQIWFVQTSKTKKTLKLGDYYYLVKIGFFNKKCNYVELRNIDGTDDKVAFKDITVQYGDGVEIEENIYEWVIKDNSKIIYEDTIDGLIIIIEKTEI